MFVAFKPADGMQTLREEDIVVLFQQHVFRVRRKRAQSGGGGILQADPKTLLHLSLSPFRGKKRNFSPFVQQNSTVFIYMVKL